MNPADDPNVRWTQGRAGGEDVMYAHSLGGPRGEFCQESRPTQTVGGLDLFAGRMCMMKRLMQGSIGTCGLMLAMFVGLGSSPASAQVGYTYSAPSYYVSPPVYGNYGWGSAGTVNYGLTPYSNPAPLIYTQPIAPTYSYNYGLYPTYGYSLYGYSNYYPRYHSSYYGPHYHSSYYGGSYGRFGRRYRW